MEFFKGVALAFNILCFIFVLFKIAELSKVLDCSGVYLALIFSIMARLQISIMEYFDVHNIGMVAFLQIQNGFLAAVAFNGLLNRVKSIIRFNNGGLRKQSSD